MMNQRGTVLLFLAVLAVIFYVVGFHTGTLAVIILGGLFELGFWLKLFGRDSNSDNDSSA